MSHYELMVGIKKYTLESSESFIDENYVSALETYIDKLEKDLEDELKQRHNIIDLSTSRSNELFGYLDEIYKISRRATQGMY